MRLLSEHPPIPSMRCTSLLLAFACIAPSARTAAQPREAGTFLAPPPSGSSPSEAPPVIGPPMPEPSTSIPAPPPVQPAPPAQSAPWGTQPAWGPTVPQPAAPLPYGVPQRLSALDSNLNALGMGSGAIVSGVIEGVTGGLFLGLGVWAHKNGSPQTGNYFYLYGGASIGRAIVDFTLRPNPQKYAIAYSNMPVQSNDDALRKLSEGERSLRHLAVMNRSARILDGVLSIAVGAISIPILLGPEGFKDADAYTYILAISGGLQIVTGLVSLIQPSNAERRWKAYRRLVASLATHQPSQVRFAERRIAFGSGMTRGGFAVSLALRF